MYQLIWLFAIAFVCTWCFVRGSSKFTPFKLLSATSRFLHDW